MSIFFHYTGTKKLLKQGSSYQLKEYIVILSSHNDSIKLLETIQLESESGL